MSYAQKAKYCNNCTWKNCMNGQMIITKHHSIISTHILGKHLNISQPNSSYGSLHFCCQILECHFKKEYTLLILLIISYQFLFLNSLNTIIIKTWSLFFKCICLSTKYANVRSDELPNQRNWVLNIFCMSICDILS